MEGNIPSVSKLATLKSMLLTSENLAQPVQLKEQLLSESKGRLSTQQSLLLSHKAYDLLLQLMTSTTHSYPAW